MKLRRSPLGKTRLQEVQDRMMLAFTLAMLLLFFAFTAAGCGVVAWKSRDWQAAAWLMPAAAVLLVAMLVQLRGFVRHGDEEARLLMQQPELEEG